MCWIKIRERRLCPLTAYFGVLIELYTTEDLITQKWNLAAVGFEPTPPKRLVPKTSALDHSATLPHMETKAILTRLLFIRAELINLFLVDKVSALEQTLVFGA